MLNVLWFVSFLCVVTGISSETGGVGTDRTVAIETFFVFGIAGAEVSDEVEAALFECLLLLFCFAGDDANKNPLAKASFCFGRIFVVSTVILEVPSDELPARSVDFRWFVMVDTTVSKLLH